MISCWPGCSVNSQKTFWGPTLKPQGGLFLFVCFWFHHYAAAELKAKKWTVVQNKVWPLPLPCQRQDLVPGARLAQPPACMQPQGTFSRRRKGLKKHPASKPAQKSLLKVSIFLWNPVVVYATISEEHHPTHSDPPFVAEHYPPVTRHRGVTAEESCPCSRTNTNLHVRVMTEFPAMHSVSIHTI